MSKRLFQALLAAVLLAGVSDAAFAQEEAGTFYVFGGIAVPHQPERRLRDGVIEIS